jgi:hypothetical protein
MWSILLLAGACGVTAVFGQSDLPAQLIGQWEGTQRQAGVGGNEDRTLNHLVGEATRGRMGR